MVRINPLNVLTLLTALFRDLQNPPSPQNNAEIDLANVLADIIVRSMNDPHFAVEEERTLDADTWDDAPFAHAVDILEDDEVPEEEFDDGDDVAQCPEASPAHGVCTDADMDLTYKTDAVTYWKSGKTKNYPWPKYNIDFVKSNRKCNSTDGIGKFHRVEIDTRNYNKLHSTL